MRQRVQEQGRPALLDAVIAYLPSPLDVPAINGFKPGDESTVIERHPDSNDPFSALAFKIAADPHLGRLTYIRLYSGKLEAGSTVLNSTKGRKERIGKIYQMHANKREEIASVGAGQIVAVMGLKDTTTGETLSDQASPVQLESMDFPAPVIEQAIEPKTKSDQEKLGTAIQRLAEEDPTFPRPHRRGDRSDHHRRHGRAAPRGADRPHEARVPRRGQHRQAAGGLPRDAASPGREGRVHPQEAVGWLGPVRRVIVSLEPLEPGSGYEFVNAVTGGRIPREYIPAVDEGIQDAMQFGVLAGYQIEDIKVTLTDGAYHDVDSSELAFKIAGSMVFKEAARRADPALLEPVMAVEVTTPEDYLGTVIGDLNARRGQIQSMDDMHGNKVVSALVPLSEMFGYVGDLRSKTSGQASYSMEFHSYAETPKSISDEIIQKARGE